MLLICLWSFLDQVIVAGCLSCEQVVAYLFVVFLVNGVSVAYLFVVFLVNRDNCC